MNLGKYTEEANNFLNEIASALGNSDDTAHASRVTNAVFKTIRERITPEESMHLISQLPMIIKGMYVDGWKISKDRSQTSTLKEFMDEVRQHSTAPAGRDFGNDEQAKENVKAVIQVLKKYVDEGEISHIKQQLPEPIAELFDA